MPPLYPVAIVIDGKFGSGIITYTLELSKQLNVTIIHCDHYFLQPHQRTNQRYELIGYNIDFERLIDDVLEPFKNQYIVIYFEKRCSNYQFLYDTLNSVNNDF